MSGGCLDYLYAKDVYTLFDNPDYLEYAAHEAENQGLPNLAKDLRAVKSKIEAALVEVEEAFEPMRKTVKALEWVGSGDWSREQATILEEWG